MRRKESLDELLAIIRSDDFEEYGRMQVVSAHWSTDLVTVRLRVDHGDGKHSSWQLRFAGVLESTLAGVDHCGLNVWRDDHPAIKQYMDRHESLHVSSAPRNETEAAGQLWQAHTMLVDDWIGFDRYINGLSSRRYSPRGTGLWPPARPSCSTRMPLYSTHRAARPRGCQRQVDRSGSNS